MVKVEEHDRVKRRKSTKRRGALTLLPSDELPSVDGTDFDPPPASSTVQFSISMICTHKQQKTTKLLIN